MEKIELHQDFKDFLKLLNSHNPKLSDQHLAFSH